jgi:DNA-binding beta-propeller fold protein YncE
MKTLLSVAFILVVVASCTKSPELPPSELKMGGGVLLVNEGNFRSGNGSLSFYSYDSLKIYNDLFNKANGRPLGDVPYSIGIKGGNAYIVVNNSGKIEVIDQSTLESVTTIGGLTSPRYISFINDNKAYVSSLYSDSVAIINLAGNKISGYINLRRSSESMIVVGNKAYIANWAGGKEIMVVNTLNDRVVDSIEVGNEPESMVLDRMGNLWVLCNGGWARQNFAELDMINIASDYVEKKLKFPTITESPTSLKIDGLGLTLYYLNNGVRQMNISDESLPFSTLISESGSHFYKLGINPVNSDIFVTDAVDYMQPGYLLIYKNSGEFVTREKANIIPGELCFKLTL